MIKTSTAQEGVCPPRPSFPLLYSITDTSHVNKPDFCHQDPFAIPQEMNHCRALLKTVLDPSPSDPHQKLIWSILSWAPASNRVTWNSVKKFLCISAEKPAIQLLGGGNKKNNDISKRCSSNLLPLQLIEPTLKTSQTLESDRSVPASVSEKKDKAQCNSSFFLTIIQPGQKWPCSQESWTSREAIGLACMLSDYQHLLFAKPTAETMP